MEENSSLPESIVLTGAAEEDEVRWLLLLGQWLHQGGGCYRRADTETPADMLLSYCSDTNKAALYQRWCTSGTCGGVRSGLCEAKLPPPTSGWQEMTGMGWAEIDMKVEAGMLAPCNLTVKARKISSSQLSEIEREGNLMMDMGGGAGGGRCMLEAISTCWPQDGSGRFRKAQKKMTDQQLRLALHCTSALPSPPHPLHPLRPIKNHFYRSPAKAALFINKSKSL